MKTSKEFTPTTKTAILLVGDPGTRKTSLAIQFPKPYVFDADNNLAGPIRHYKDVAFAFDHAHEASEDWKVTKFGIDYKKGDVIDPLHRYLWMTSCLNSAVLDDGVETLILDSLTSVADIVMNEVRRQEGRKLDDPLRIQDWGKFAFLMKNLVTQLKTSNKLFIMTAHNVIDKDEADGCYKTFLAVPGQSKTTLSALFTDVWSTYLKQGGPPNNRTYEYRIRTLPSGEQDHRGLKDSLGLDKTFDWGMKQITEKLSQ